MIAELRSGIRPQQIGQIIAGELLAGLEREPDQKGEVFARTKTHLLAGYGEQGGSPKAVQLESVYHMAARFLDPT